MPSTEARGPVNPGLASMVGFGDALAGMDYGHRYLTKEEASIALSLLAEGLQYRWVARVIARRRHDEDRDNQRALRAWLAERRLAIAA